MAFRLCIMLGVCFLASYVACEEDIAKSGKHMKQIGEPRRRGSTILAAENFLVKASVEMKNEDAIYQLEFDDDLNLINIDGDQIQSAKYFVTYNAKNDDFDISANSVEEEDDLQLDDDLDKSYNDTEARLLVLDPNYNRLIINKRYQYPQLITNPLVNVGRSRVPNYLPANIPSGRLMELYQRLLQKQAGRSNSINSQQFLNNLASSLQNQVRSSVPRASVTAAKAAPVPQQLAANNIVRSHVPHHQHHTHQHPQHVPVVSSIIYITSTEIHTLTAVQTLPVYVTSTIISQVFHSRTVTLTDRLTSYVTYTLRPTETFNPHNTHTPILYTPTRTPAIVQTQSPVSHHNRPHNSHSRQTSNHHSQQTASLSSPFFRTHNKNTDLALRNYLLSVRNSQLNNSKTPNPLKNSPPIRSFQRAQSHSNFQRPQRQPNPNYHRY